MAVISRTPRPPTGRSSTVWVSSGTRTFANGSCGGAVSSYVSATPSALTVNVSETGASHVHEEQRVDVSQRSTDRAEAGGDGPDTTEGETNG